ncbi:hypothetical protein Tco_1364058, partial [Tanacetum coccineum]
MVTPGQNVRLNNLCESINQINRAPIADKGQRVCYVSTTALNFDKPCFVAQKEQTVDRASYSVQELPRSRESSYVPFKVSSISTSVRDGISGIGNRPVRTPFNLGEQNRDQPKFNNLGKSTYTSSVEDSRQRQLPSSTQCNELTNVGIPSDSGKKRKKQTKFNGFRVKKMRLSGGLLLQQSRSSGGCIPQDIHTSTNVDALTG